MEEPVMDKLGKLMKDDSAPMSDRYRALFTLRNIGGRDVINIIAGCFSSNSVLFKHECAYCLGQLQDEYALPYLTSVLEDNSEDAMVRHEAGEALGAIGSKEVVPVLQKYSLDEVIEVAETCQLALARIQWVHDKDNPSSNNPYKSVDPAPPCVDVDDTESLKQMLLDEKLPLFKRYRAMFSLRNKSDKDSVLALSEGLKCSSALFRHEIAYVLGQVQHEACITQLAANLKDCSESPMVRHECAEALGAIATPECMQILKTYLQDKEAVVKESCVVALDVSEYNNSTDLQYANGLTPQT